MHLSAEVMQPRQVPVYMEFTDRTICVHKNCFNPQKVATEGPKEEGWGEWKEEG